MADNISNELIRVDSLIPSQLLDDAADLREFIKKYYEYLNSTDEQVGQNQPSYLITNVLEFRDLDRSVDEFIDLIRRELGQGISQQLLTNKANLYKYAKEIYSSKGSVDSFKLIFRLLFGKEIEFTLPKEQILIASDGRWQQDFSIFAELTDDGNKLVGKRITIQTPSGLTSTFEVLFSRQLANVEDTYELFISRDFNATIEVGSTISDSGITGTVLSALNAGTISKAGSGFKVGQIFNVQNEFGTGASIKIKAVDNNGGITAFSILSFGVGYESPFFTSIASNVNVSSDDVDFDITYDGPSETYTVGFTDNNGGFKDSGFIVQQEYFSEDYVSGTYAGTVLTSWSDDRTYDQDDVIIEDDDTAIIYFTLGALCEYEGYFKTNKGFLSDSIYLQDNYFYQNFSYLINVDEKFENYSDALNLSVHPAGMIGFGQYDISNTIDISADITDVYREIPLIFSDTVAVSESATLNISLDEQDSVSISEQPSINNNTILSDATTLSDAGSIFVNAYAIDYFAEDYVETTAPVETF